MERQQPTPTRGRNHPRFPLQQGEEVAGLLSQSPIVCLAIPSPAKPRADKTFVVHPTGNPLQTPAIFSQPPIPTGVGVGEQYWCSLERR